MVLILHPMQQFCRQMAGTRAPYEGNCSQPSENSISFDEISAWGWWIKTESTESYAARTASWRRSAKVIFDGTGTSVTLGIPKMAI
jgi:hypothetical protein